MLVMLTLAGCSASDQPDTNVVPETDETFFFISKDNLLKICDSKEFISAENSEKDDHLVLMGEGKYWIYNSTDNLTNVIGISLSSNNSSNSIIMRIEDEEGKKYDLDINFGDSRITIVRSYKDASENKQEEILIERSDNEACTLVSREGEITVSFDKAYDLWNETLSFIDIQLKDIMDDRLLN